MQANRKVLLSFLVLSTMGALLLGQGTKPAPSSGTEMAAAAKEFLAALTPEQRDDATYGYDDPERLNWHFIPRERNGLSMKRLEGDALTKAHAFIQSGLSHSGYDQTASIMSLEEILFLLEGGEREYRRARRDPQNYFLTVFGTPGDSGTWGWRLEGHHLSLNYSIKDGKVVSSTPEFFGTNPALVDAGPERAIRVLGTEEDLARQVLKIATPEQQKTMWISKEAPDEIRAPGELQAPSDEPVGITIADMSSDQKRLMQQLLSEYLGNMPSDVEQERRARINEAGIDKIHFAWWGSSEKDERHYYRVQGPTFLIEYNNTQNNANHVHSVWRNLAGDLNVPAEAG